MALARPATNNCFRHGTARRAAPRSRQYFQSSVGNNLRRCRRLSAPRLFVRTETSAGSMGRQTAHRTFGRQALKCPKHGQIDVSLWGAKQTSLFERVTSAFDPMYGPAVRCKNFVELAVSGLASMYPASDWSVVLRAIMDISARAISLAARPRPGHLGHQCSHAPGRPNLHLVSSSRRPRRVNRIDQATSSRAPHLARLISRWTRSGSLGGPYRSLLRSSGRGPERSRQCGPACWQVRSPARCGAAASWPPRSRA